MPSSAATTVRDFKTIRDFFASMETVFEHGNGRKSRLVVAAEDGIKLGSSKSSVQSTAADHVGQNSSAHVAPSVAAIWPLILFK